MQDTINIAAVDDLPADLERLGAALETYAAQHELTIEVSGFRSGEELLEAAASGGFDIVFLDIVMDGIDGLETRAACAPWALRPCLFSSPRRRAMRWRATRSKPRASS